MFRKALLVLLAIVIALGWILTLAEEAPAADAPENENTAIETEAAGDDAAEPDAADESGDAGEASPSPANGYVLVSTSTQSGWLPLPAEGEYSYHLKQVASDGTELENVIHLTPNGVYMEDSTCDNHDCVDQGEVTLENRNDRVLTNMIICLPNQVYLQLFTPEEVMAMAQAELAQQAEGAN